MKRCLRTALIFVMICTLFLQTAAPVLAQPGGVKPRETQPLKLWYDEEAPQSSRPAGKADWTWQDIGSSWEKWSLPLGNGYMGANVFGGAQTERIQITENSFRHPYTASNIEKYNSSMNSFVETYIDFGHTDVENYYRDLVLDDATAHVTYELDGVEYQREYFTSYPDKVMVMRFTASEGGKVSFTLAPQTPYIKDYNKVPGDGLGKTGTVSAEGDTVTFGGELTSYNIQYEGQYKVIPEGAP